MSNTLKTYKVKVQIIPQSNILDPQGSTVEKSLKSLGYTNIENVKVGKEIVFNIDSESEEKAKIQITEMCERLLANPVIEDYVIEIK